MGWLDKIIPKEVKKPFKAVGKLSKKFLPKELRPWLPMVTPFLPAMGIMGQLGGPMGFAKMYGANLLSQQLADPDAEFDDLNQLSAFLSGTQGGLMGTDTAQNLRDMTTRGIELEQGATGEQLQRSLANRSFWDKTKDLGLEGLATASDYLQGGAETLGALGSGEMDLFTKEGAKKGLAALAVPGSKGMGDVAEAYQRPAIRDWEAADAAEQAEMEATTTANEQEQADLTMKYYRQAGHDEETIQEALEINGLGDYYVPPVTAANGGIIGLKHGGMLNFGGREMDLRGGGFVPIGRKETADDVPA